MSLSWVASQERSLYWKKKQQTTPNQDAVNQIYGGDIWL